MGGIALGKAVVTSGLLDTMDGGIRRMVEGLPLYEVVLALSAVVMASRYLPHYVGKVLIATPS